MDESPRSPFLSSKILDWLLHPIVLFLSLGATVYSASFLSNPITRSVTAVLAFLVMALLAKYVKLMILEDAKAQAVSQEIKEIEEGSLSYTLARRAQSTKIKERIGRS